MEEDIRKEEKKWGRFIRRSKRKGYNCKKVKGFEYQLLTRYWMTLSKELVDRNEDYEK